MNDVLHIARGGFNVLEKFESENQEKIARLNMVLDKLAKDSGALIPILQKAQEIFGYLPSEVMILVGKRIGVSLSKIYGVVTFYGQFHLKPRGRNVVRSCQGTACHVRGAGAVMERMAAELGLEKGETTTADLGYTLESVACIGCCGLAPALTINGDTHGRLTPDVAAELLKRYA